MGATERIAHLVETHDANTWGTLLDLEVVINYRLPGSLAANAAVLVIPALVADAGGRGIEAYAELCLGIGRHCLLSAALNNLHPISSAGQTRVPMAEPKICNEPSLLVRVHRYA